MPISNLSRKSKLTASRPQFATSRRIFSPQHHNATPKAKGNPSFLAKEPEIVENKEIVRAGFGEQSRHPDGTQDGCSGPQESARASRAALAAEELELARMAQAGDQGAFTRLVQPHIRKTYHVALRITRNREDAEDASQQSLINAYSHMDQFRGQARFSSWLLRIAINEALIKVRKRRSEDRHVCYESDPELGSNPVDSLRAGESSHPEVIYSTAEKSRFLREAIGGLGKTTRVVVHLLGLQELQAKEAARMLNLSQSAVKTRFSRARRQMRESMGSRISNSERVSNANYFREECKAS